MLFSNVEFDQEISIASKNIADFLFGCLQVAQFTVILRVRSFGIFRIFSSWEQNSRNLKSRYSRMRIAPKQTLTRIISIILIPD